MTTHERTSLSANAPDIFNCQRQAEVIGLWQTLEMSAP